MRRTVVSLAIVTQFLLALTTPALATFPGGNGRIAYDANHDIFTVKPNGQDRVKIAENGIEPAWSPDGSRIAFVRLVDDGNLNLYGNIWVMDADGSDPLQLTSGIADDRDPAWSSDGSRIVFTRNPDPNGSASTDIWVMDADGSSKDGLTATASYEFTPDVSVDDVIVYYRTGSSAGLWTMDLDGGNRQVLRTAPLPIYNPSWSPSAGRIAYEYYCGAGPGSVGCEIISIKADGTDRRRLTNNDLVDSEPAFSPDGRRIAFRSFRTVRGRDLYGILTMSRAGGDERRVTRSINFPSHNEPSWQPLPLP